MSNRGETMLRPGRAPQRVPQFYIYIYIKYFYNPLKIKFLPSKKVDFLVPPLPKILVPPPMSNVVWCICSILTQTESKTIKGAIITFSISQGHTIVKQGIEQGQIFEQLQTLILASISLNLSKSLSAALLFCTINFLPQELFSHLFFTSVIKYKSSILETSKMGKKKKWHLN